MENGTELVQPVDSPDFEALLQDWALAHVDPETGLCRVECCGRRVAVSETVVYRDETVLSVTLADCGSLLCGLLVRYHVFCTACRREKERTVAAIRADVDAVIEAGVAADLALANCPRGEQNLAERSEEAVSERSEESRPEEGLPGAPRWDSPRAVGER